MSILYNFINIDVVNDPMYFFSESDLYPSPEVREDVDGYLEYIKTLPVNPLPEVYGLHENADITKDNQETNLVILIIFERLSIVFYLYAFISIFIWD